MELFWEGPSSLCQRCSNCALQVLEKVSPNPREVKAVAANSNSSKNRSMDFLPSECVCVCVCQGWPT